MSSLKKDLPEAKKCVFRILNIRLRSEKEILDYLKKKEFPNEVINDAVSYFKGLNLINDRIFAEKWIISRLNRPLGFKRIAIELNNKGVNRTIIEQEIAKQGKEFSEIEIVEKLAKRRAALYKNIEPLKIKQRVYGYLLRRGFDQNAVLKALLKI